MSAAKRDAALRLETAAADPPEIEIATADPPAIPPAIEIAAAAAAAHFERLVEGMRREKQEGPLAQMLADPPDVAESRILATSFDKLTQDDMATLIRANPAAAAELAERLRTEARSRVASGTLVSSWMDAARLSPLDVQHHGAHAEDLRGGMGDSGAVRALSMLAALEWFEYLQYQMEVTRSREADLKERGQAMPGVYPENVAPSPFWHEAVKSADKRAGIHLKRFESLVKTMAAIHRSLGSGRRP